MLQNGTSRVNKRTNKNVYCNTRGLVEQGVLGIVIGVVIGSEVTSQSLRSRSPCCGYNLA